MEDKIRKYIWGTVEHLDIEKGNYTSKIVVFPKQEMPLQKTMHEILHWTIIAGTGLVIYDGQLFPRNCGEGVDIHSGVQYLIRNEAEDTELKLIEVSIGNSK